MDSKPARRLEQFFPFLAWPRLWRKVGLRGDVIAGITVAMVLVPQALAYAQLASLPPQVGLYAALLPAVVAALFGSCGQLSTGPVALTALLTGASLLPLARPDHPDFLAFAILLALMSGLIQLALGALKAGWLLNLLSRPVMTGFINAAALLISLSQLPALLGLAQPNGNHLLANLTELVTQFDRIDPRTATFGLGALSVLVVLRRLTPALPGVLIVVAGSIAVSAATGFAAHGGSVIGAIPAGLPELALPAVHPGAIATLLPAAFVIALVSFMEATSSATLISGRLRENWNRNQELIGQGLAKLAAACSGAMPVSASFSRSALNYASGARTGLSSLVAAIAVLLALLYLTPLLWHLPNAVLAAVILLVVTGLLDLRALARAWQAGRADGLASAVTFVATLAFAPNIQNGILTGLLLSLALMLYRDMRPRVALLGLHPDGTYRDLDRFGLQHPDPQLVIMRFDSPLTFVTAEAFEHAVVDSAHAQPDVRTVLVSAAGVNAIDASGLHAIAQLVERFAAEGRLLAFCGLKKQVIDAMERTGLWSRLTPHAHYRTEAHALATLLPTTAAPAMTAQTDGGVTLPAGQPPGNALDR
ncbi:MAG: SulP family inorganic anion transporter [Rhodocyclaceae bacterium]